MMLSVAVVFLFVWGGMRGASLIPGRLQSLVESAYEFLLASS
jgi:F0F1-type ATP synthase membrane subunit a